MCVIRIPYPKHTDLKNLDIIEISSVAFPLFQGTDPDPGPPTHYGEPVETAHGGEHVRQAKTYKAQITRYELRLIEDEPPAIDLTCRLLIHKHDPT
jgi:hypothetical protein